MPQSSTLSYVADLVIRRTLAEVAEKPGQDMGVAIEAAYPFDHSVEARRIWLDALIRYAVITETAVKKKVGAA